MTVLPVPPRPTYVAPTNLPRGGGAGAQRRLEGDCQIERDFAIQALERFRDPNVAIVWGRLREAFPSASPYNRLMDVQWICLRNLPAGPTFYGTGIGLVRRSALEAAGGSCDSLTAGENTDLGRRVQALGYLILHVELPIGKALHGSWLVPALVGRRPRRATCAHSASICPESRLLAGGNAL